MPIANIRESVMPEAASVAQLRREAEKARTLGDAAFGEEEKRQLHEIADALDREATAMDAALAAIERKRPTSADQRAIPPTSL